jgi:hypothetical protein
VAPELVENLELMFELSVDDVVKVGREEMEEVEAWVELLSPESALEEEEHKK